MLHYIKIKYGSNKMNQQQTGSVQTGEQRLA